MHRAGLCVRESKWGGRIAWAERGPSGHAGRRISSVGSVESDAAAGVRKLREQSHLESNISMFLGRLGDPNFSEGQIVYCLRPPVVRGLNLVQRSKEDPA